MRGPLDLSHLNDEQAEAVRYIKDPLLVLAGAGSGKTRVITYRIAYMIQAGIEPEQILAVSFTNKSAGEMRDRVAGLIGAELTSKVQISTFHSWGVSMLRKEGHRIGLRRGFSILDRSDQISLLKELMAELRVRTSKLDLGDVLGLISKARNHPGTLADMKELKFHPYRPFLQRLLKNYDKGLRLRNAVDFDDLLLQPVNLLETLPKVREHYQKKCRYIMVDEYQDTNAIQFRLLNLLGKIHRNVCVVGDDDQSIYAFRGSDSSHILHFEHHFPGAKLIKLERNYRSTGHILNASYGVIKHNRTRHDKKVWTALGDGKKVRLLKVLDNEDEGRVIADEIGRIVGDKKYNWSDFAVLYRTNPQSRPIEERLRSAGVPYQVLGGTSFFDRQEVRDAVAYLRVAVNPRDDVALRRILNVPPRAIGPGTRQKLEKFGAANSIHLYNVLSRSGEVPGLTPGVKSSIAKLLAAFDKLRINVKSNRLCDAVRLFLKEIHFEDHLKSGRERPETIINRLENVDQLISSIIDFEKHNKSDLGAYLNRLSLDGTAPDRGEKQRNQVTLLTLHASKGLEFPVVFIAGFEHGLLPHGRSTSARELSEERRLCYVGMTRAEKQLFLLEAQSRTRRGRSIPSKPSMFLAEIPDANIDCDDGQRAEEVRKEQARDKMSALWAAIGGPK